MTNLEKRSVLQKIIMHSRVAINKLDEITYYSNMLESEEGVNKQHFQQLLAEATREFNEANEKVHELNESLLF